MSVKKCITIGYIYSESANQHLPYVRLQGKWLAKLGWYVGCKLEVIADENHKEKREE